MRSILRAHAIMINQQGLWKKFEISLTFAFISSGSTQVDFQFMRSIRKRYMRAQQRL